MKLKTLLIVLALVFSAGAASADCDLNANSDAMVQYTWPAVAGVDVAFFDVEAGWEGGLDFCFGGGLHLLEGIYKLPTIGHWLERVLDADAI